MLDFRDTVWYNVDMMKANNNLKGSLILGVASLVWGLAFVAQSQAAEHVPPFLFNALRSFIGAAFLFLLCAIKKIRMHAPILPKEKAARRDTLISSLLCGLLLTVSVNFQQFGLSAYPDGTAGSTRAGFLTALYVVLVPIFSLVCGKKLRIPVACAGLVAAVGVYLLSLSEGLDAIYLGDILVFCCAISFSLHIMVVDAYSTRVDGMVLSMLQFWICGVASLALSAFFESATVENILAAVPQILYLGILSSGVGYTLQIYGQKYAEPAIASLTMSLESVFAAMGGWLIMGDLLSPKELIGCGLVFAAIVLAQLPQLWEKKSKRQRKPTL